MLQTRNAKRPAQAAVRFAVDAVDEGLLDPRGGAATIDAGLARRAAAPDLRPAARLRVAGHAASRASPGRGQGRDRVHAPTRPSRAAADGARRDPRAAVHRGRRRGRLPRRRGILTSEGGKASHAALVARGHGPALRVRAPRELEIDLEASAVRVGRRRVLHAGDRIAIDGSTGTSRPTTSRSSSPRSSDDFETVLRWADELRRLGVRANADTPRTRGARASSAPRASACAAPSTCSWPRTASRRCGR